MLFSALILYNAPLVAFVLPYVILLDISEVLYAFVISQCLTMYTNRKLFYPDFQNKYYRQS